METEEGRLVLDQKTIDILVANIIPTSKYFEIRFDYLQQDVDGVKKQLEDVKNDVKRLDEQQDKRFTAMQSDMDKRFERVDEKLDKIIERIDRRIAEDAYV
jgi:archaellum component FlaC